jgi:hypothetical protein
MCRLSRRDFIKAGSALAFGGRLLVGGPRAYAGTVHRKNMLPGEIFTDRAREAGIDFVHFNGVCGQHYYPRLG